MSRDPAPGVRVWAPHPSSVALATPDEGVRPMRSVGGGWWEGPGLGPGRRYGFMIDGQRRPDPRSARQPEGVEGWSEVVDHDAFPWTDAGWRGRALADCPIYELHVGTFSPTGDFAGVAGRLDHLVELGVGAVELLPVAAFPGRRGWGYDGVALFAPHEPYGGPDGLKSLVDACHARGIAVVLDVVYNHLGPSGNHLGEFGPYFTDSYRTPWGSAVNVDQAGSDEVRRFVVDNALQWVVDYHVDGLRLDAVHAIHDESAVHVLEELAGAVHAAASALGRTVWVVAESDLNDPRLVRDVRAGGFGLDAAWSDDLHHALHVALTGEREGYYADFAGLGDVAEALDHVYVYRGRHAPSRGRRHGRPVGGLDRSRFVVFAQNHDQVGNRALGERLGQLAGAARQQVAAALVLTGPAVPLLFQGEEWAASTPFRYFTDHDDPDLARAVSAGRRREFAAFGWPADRVPDPQDPATFEVSVLDWAERARPPHSEMLDWYRRLLRLRRERPGLRDPRPASTSTRVDPGGHWLVVSRPGVDVVVNLGGPGPVPLGDRRATGAPLPVLMSSDPGVTVGPDEVGFPGDGVVLLERPGPGGGG